MHYLLNFIGLTRTKHLHIYGHMSVLHDVPDNGKLDFAEVVKAEGGSIKPVDLTLFVN
jgi:hypothetical protein